MRLAPATDLDATLIHRTLIGRHLEASSHVRRRHERQHPRCAGRPAGQWAAGISGSAYVIDDQSAIKVVDGTVEVISEGQWKLLNA
jgi:hypothetical protein